MALFVSIVLISVGLTLVGIGGNAWSRGGYSNVVLAGWWGIAGYLFFGFGAWFTYYSYVIKPAKTATEARPAGRGYLSILNIQPLPAKLIAGEKPTAYVTWGNDGASPVEITGGFVQLFVSLISPSKVVIPCDKTGSDIAPVVIARSPRSQKFTSQNAGVFSTEQVDAVNKGSQFFGICGQANYTTAGQPFTLRFCSYYDPDEKTYVDCKREANPN
jgi:hypothetical protein